MCSRVSSAEIARRRASYEPMPGLLLTPSQTVKEADNGASVHGASAAGARLTSSEGREYVDLRFLEAFKTTDLLNLDLHKKE